VRSGSSCAMAHCITRCCHVRGRGDILLVIFSESELCTSQLNMLATCQLRKVPCNLCSKLLHGRHGNPC
jgi:hypothetical protein